MNILLKFQLPHCEIRVSWFQLPLKWASWGSMEATALSSCFTFPSRGKWWLQGNFSMAQLCAACSMRITGFSVEQWALALPVWDWECVEAFRSVLDSDLRFKIVKFYFNLHPCVQLCCNHTKSRGLDSCAGIHSIFDIFNDERN